MKFKNVVAGLPVQIKKSKCPKGSHPDMQYEVLRIEQHDNKGKNILVQHDLWVGWFNHRDLKKPTKRKPEPQLKQLDQSVFDGRPDYWKFFAIDENGQGWFYRNRPSVNEDDKRWMESNRTPTRSGYGYDASNWRNSLITRDTANKLTGSDLCKAMLARGDTRIMCIVSDENTRQDLTHVIRAYADGKFHTKANRWTYAIPINNKGEPLTAKDVGLQQGKT